MWLQHLLVLTVVAASVAVVARLAFRTLVMRGRSKLGACCAKGCEAPMPAAKSSPQVHFLPVDSLNGRR
jgi:hypothetical protein